MPCSSTYCIKNTGLVGADDNYITGGTYNGNTYWTGQTSGWTIYYYTGVTSYWCLSDSLGGSCYLTGKYPCVSSCPDLSNIYVFSGVCLTPTPTPTKNCDVLDFTAIFDCEFIPTPTQTPTATVTPTMTMTPSSTNFCSIIGIDAIGYEYTPTPTPTPSITPTEYDENTLQRRLFYSSQIVRDCPINNSVSFSAITGQIICPGVMKWQDCYNTSKFYYSDSIQGLPLGISLTDYIIFGAIVDGTFKCISYFGMDYDKLSENTITYSLGPYGSSIDGDCINCQIVPTPTPTKTPTQTPTKTPGVSPSKTPTSTPTQTPTKNPTKTPTPTPTLTPCLNCVESPVTIGTQTWDKCNLDVTTYRDGTPIPQVTDPIAWDALTTGAWCYYDNDPANNDIYGKLYNWYAVNNTINGGLAPLGKHIPTDAEWTTLTDFLGGASVAGGKMKETGFCHWNSPNTNATNSSGFTALPGGIRSAGGVFFNIGNFGWLWSSSENVPIPPSASARLLRYNSGNVLTSDSGQESGFSVRCIID
jgi:uncharacterized protein (TIGR02145 family)